MGTGPTFESMFPYGGVYCSVYRWHLEIEYLNEHTVTACAAAPYPYYTSGRAHRNCLINSEPSAPDAADGPRINLVNASRIIII